VLIIMKTRIWLFFGASIWLFFGLIAVMFALLKWGTHMVIRKKDEPRLPPPMSAD